MLKGSFPTPLRARPPARSSSATNSPSQNQMNNSVKANSNEVASPGDGGTRRIRILSSMATMSTWRGLK